MKKSSNKFTLLISITTSLFCFFVFFSSSLSRYNGDCFCNSGYGLDPIEYHFLSANFALHNQFPVLGFIGNAQQYKICKENTDAADYLNTVEKIGPIAFTGRPPFYPIVLGFLYKIFGFRPIILYELNVLSILLTAAFIPFLANLLLGRTGLISGVVCSFIYCWMNKEAVAINDAECFSKVPVIIFSTCLISAIKFKKCIYYFMGGIVLGITLLTKGTITIFLLLFILYSFYIALRTRSMSSISKASFLCFGLGVTLLPWILFINNKADSSLIERRTWHNQLSATVPNINVASKQDLLDTKTGKYSKTLQDYCNKTHQLRYIVDSAFILLTNQVNREILLSDHNEFCLDGDYHPEYQVITTSYHNTTHLNKWVWSKILHYYLDHPLSGMQILYAKIATANNVKPRLFMLFGLLMGLWGFLELIGNSNRIVSQKRLLQFLLAFLLAYALYTTFSNTSYYQWLLHTTISSFVMIALLKKPQLSTEAVFALFFFNFLLLILIIYGDVRFIAIMDSVWLVGCIYMPAVLLRQLKSLQLL